MITVITPISILSVSADVSFTWCRNGCSLARCSRNVVLSQTVCHANSASQLSWRQIDMRVLKT